MKALEVIACLKNSGIDAAVTGSMDTPLEGFSSIYQYRSGSLTWLRNRDTLLSGKVNAREAACLITGEDVSDLLPTGCQILVSDPKDAFFRVVEHFWGEKNTAVIASTAVVEAGAVIGKNVSIGHHSFISAKAVIGDNCRIGNNVSIQGKVTMGTDCFIESGAVIGAEGFAFQFSQDEITHFPHYGGVEIGSHVYIGANTCICRGAIDDTYIADYVQINNLCHIAHNDRIHTRTTISAGTTLMGSVTIGSDCWISTSVVRDQLTIGNHSRVGMGGAVTKDVPDNTVVVGVPAKPMIKG